MEVIKGLEDIRPIHWREMSRKIESGKFTVLVGDDLVRVRGKKLNDYLREKLYNYCLESSRMNDSDFEKKYELTIDSSILSYFTKKEVEDFCRNDDGSIALFLEKTIAEISEEDVDVSLFRQLIEETRVKVIISTCYSPFLQKCFIEYAHNNRLFPHIGEILGGESTGGLTYYSRQKDNNKIKWKECSKWENMNKGEILFLNIGGNFKRGNENIYNLSVSEDDWVKKISQWIVSIQLSAQAALAKHLSESYLLVLGSSIPSWAFRFFWYTLNNPLSNSPANMSSSLSARPEPHNENVKRYIKSHNSLIISANKTDAFVKELIKRWKESDEYERMIEKIRQAKPTNEHIFISYLSDDRIELDENLIPILESLEKEHGYSFWYDQRQLKGGVEWENAIMSAIDNVCCFIPFLTKRCKEVAGDERYLRNEWTKAIKKSDKINEELGGYAKAKFILPITLGEVKETMVEQFARYQSIEIRKDNQKEIKEGIIRIIKDYKTQHEILR